MQNKIMLIQMQIIMQMNKEQHAKNATKVF